LPAFGTATGPVVWEGAIDDVEDELEEDVTDDEAEDDVIDELPVRRRDHG